MLDRFAALQDDDTALSVFADELVQAGDVRGEYLALSRAIEQLPHWRRRWAAATFESRRIQASVFRAWRDSGALADLPAALQVGLTAGAPTRLEGPCAALTRAPPFALAKVIRALDVTTVSPDLTSLLALPWLPQVRALELRNGPRYGDSIESQDEELRALLTSPATASLQRLSCQLPHSFSGKVLLDAGCLRHLKHLELLPQEAARLIEPGALLSAGPLPLRSLVLRDAMLTYAAVEGLKANLVQLTRLKLEAATLSAGGLQPLAGGLPSLRRLELLEVDLDWEALADLFESGFAPQLESIELYQLRRTRTARYSPGFARFIAALATRPLQHLRLNRLDLSLYDLETFVEAGLLPRLESLGFDENLIGELGVERLARAEAPNLRALSLAWCGFSDRGAAAIVKAPWLPQLHALELHQNELNAAMLRGIFGTQPLPRLRLLRLPIEHRISLNGALLPSLVAVEPPPPANSQLNAGAPPLETLQLEAPTDAQLEALAQSPHARAIRKLELKTPADVTDAGILALVESEHLAGVLDFNLRYPAISQKAQRAVNDRFGFPQFAVSDPWRE